MKHTLRFLMVSLCLVFSISAFADRRGADLFKPAGNRTSPSQWTRSNSGNNFSYSRYGGRSYSGYSNPYGQQPAVGRSSFYGSSDDQSAYTGYTGQQYATDDFLQGENGLGGPQHIKRGATPGGTEGPNVFNPGDGAPVGDALPCLLLLAAVFVAYKSRRKLAGLLSR